MKKFNPDTPLRFGKHRGKTWKQVKAEDPGYVTWALGNLDSLTQAAKDYINSLFRANLEYPLAADQQAAVDRANLWLDTPGEKAFRLQGGAGYGKSFAVTQIASDARDRNYTIHGTACSYVATQVLAQSLDPVGASSATIARTLGMAPERNTKRGNYLETDRTEEKLDRYLGDRRLLIVDEYSMVSDRQADLIERKLREPGNTAKLLVVGDCRQLPSPEQTHMCSFDTIAPWAELDIPKRFAPGSDLHKLEQAVRQDPFSLETHLLDLDGEHVRKTPDFDSLVQEVYRLNRDHPEQTSLLLAYRRDRVLAVNREVRTSMFGEDAEEIVTGEKLRVMRTTFLENTDSRFYSGTYITAETVEKRVVDYPFCGKTLSVPCWHVNGTPVIFSKSEAAADENSFGGGVFNSALGVVADYCKEVESWQEYHAFRNHFVQVGYGYATTVHRSQGASVDNIFFRPQDIIQGGSAAPKLAYVAATRARKKIIWCD